MKYINIKTIALVVVAGLGLTACEDFLDKPTIDNYNADNYYNSDVECLAGTSYLYSSPWSDFTRPFIKIGEILSGNYYPGTSPYLDFSVNGSDADISSLSNSLWAAVAHCNTIYNYINKASGPSAAGKGQTMGECLTWKAIAYFFLVRTFGDIPIIHNNSAELESGTYNTAVKVKKVDVYEYIIMTLEKAIEILPETPLQAGRIDKAAAEGLLAKVYLTKAGVSGAINTEDLDNAVKYARLCLAHSSHGLMERYPDVFRLANNINPECLISWRWNANNNQWTDQSFMQNDYAPKGFGDDDCWAQWAGMSTDLQEAFGIKILDQTPDVWLNNRDARLKATMMLPGYKYDYFWTDKGGFDFLRFIYDATYNPSVELSSKQEPWLVSPTGSYPVKHLYGDNADHTLGVGYPAARMANSLATPLLRISDVKLVLAEALLLLNNANSPQTATTNNAEALKAFNDVRQRAGLTTLTTLSFNDIWKERRLELAFEGDRWYDFVRVSYYNSDFCVNELKSQTRIPIGNGTLNDIYENYYKTGNWVVSDEAKQAFEDSKKREPAPLVEQLLRTDSDSGKKYFAIPMTERDVVFNPNLAASAEAVHVDVRATYKY